MYTSASNFILEINDFHDEEMHPETVRFCENDELPIFRKLKNLEALFQNNQDSNFGSKKTHYLLNDAVYLRLFIYKGTKAK